MANSGGRRAREVSDIEHALILTGFVLKSVFPVRREAAASRLFKVLGAAAYRPRERGGDFVKLRRNEVGLVSSQAHYRVLWMYLKHVHEGGLCPPSNCASLPNAGWRTTSVRPIASSKSACISRSTLEVFIPGVAIALFDCQIQSFAERGFNCDTHSSNHRHLDGNPSVGAAYFQWLRKTPTTKPSSGGDPARQRVAKRCKLRRGAPVLSCFRSLLTANFLQ
jgi:hypothetical protein